MPMTRGGGVLRLIAAAALASLLGGCASFSDSFSPVEANLAANAPSDALAALEKQRYGHGDRVLYLLNKGMLLRIAGDYKGSNDTFEAAKQRIDALYGTSVSEQAASFLINDATKAYVGADYEQVLIHLYMALNYLDLNELMQARVEAQQVDVTLRAQAQRNSEQRYTEDALARYLTGTIYESLGEWSDAMISYRQAYDAYGVYVAKYGTPMPQFLGPDLVRLARKEGRTADLAKFAREFPAAANASEGALAGMGDLIFTLHEGLAPIKREHSATVVAPESGRLVRISLPTYQVRPTPVRRARITVGDNTVTTDLAEDINAIAVKDLDAKMPLITARAIARAVVKDRTAKQAGKQNDVLGLVVNIANVLTERADTRSWLTLPGRVHLAEVAAPPGSYTVKVELLDYDDNVIAAREFPNVALARGRKTYLSYHWIPAQARR
jgi:hypothetical protein